MNGFLLIDKESGINSFKLVVALRRLAGEKRIGFAGTLDPLASGLMILALGEYTKLLPYLEAKDKVYQVRVRLGQVSDTYDVDGKVEDVQVNFSDGKQPTLEQIEAILQRDFQGEVKQIPPRFSAIKIDGVRAYDMAREGQQFEMKSRSVQIFYTKILEYKYPELDLEVHCSSGTYVRSIAHDLGQMLGCGGVVSELRRLKIGDIGVGRATPLASLNSDELSKFFIPTKEVFPDRQILNLNENQYEILAKGNFVPNLEGLEGEALGVFRDEVVGVVETTDNGSKLKFKKKLLIF